MMDLILGYQSVTVEDLHAPQEGGQGQPISGHLQSLISKLEVSKH